MKKRLIQYLLSIKNRTEREAGGITVYYDEQGNRLGCQKVWHFDEELTFEEFLETKTKAELIQLVAEIKMARRSAPLQIPPGIMKKKLIIALAIFSLASCQTSYQARNYSGIREWKNGKPAAFNRTPNQRPQCVDNW